MKNPSTHLLGTLAAVLAFQGVAMAQPKGLKNLSAERLSIEERQKREQTIREKFPQFSLPITFGQRKEAGDLVPTHSERAAQPPFKAPKVTQQGGRMKITAASGAEILVNITYAPGMTSYNDRSIVNMNTADPATQETLATGNYSFYNGVGIIGDYFYGCYNIYYESYGYFPSIYTFDMDTWELVETEYPDGDYSLMAQETAMAADGTIYGSFFNATGTARELGVVDYANGTRTTIGPATKYYCAMGVTKENVLYGIAIDGNLYRIDTATGAETLVGPTGVTIANSSGNFYQQTGEIDQKDNTFYWLGTDFLANTTSLYTVNLETGAATKHYEFGEYTFAGMLIPQANVADGAPDAAQELKADFANGQLTGEITFKAPTQTFGGSVLTGDINYTVKANDVTLASGKTTPGANVSASVTAAEGMQTFVVTTQNAAGESPKAKVRTWVGLDTPKPVTDVTLAIDNSSGVATLTWTAPTEGTHDGYIGSLRYDVYRITAGGTTLVSEKQSGTAFTETLTKDGIANYAYSVTAFNGSRPSSAAQSNTVLLGDAYTVPYTENFNSAERTAIWTVIDANHDATQTSYGLNGGWTLDAKEGTASYLYGDVTADDWLISPAVRLKAGQAYMISVEAKARSASGKVYPEVFEVKLGKEATAAAMITDVIARTDVNTDTYQTFTSPELRVTEDGDYHIGIHALSSPDAWTLYINTVSVEAAVLPTAPEAVKNLQVTPATDARLEATVSFRTPSQTVSGDALTAPLTKIEILRDGILVHTLNNQSLNTEVTWTDTQGLTNGEHLYRVVPYIGTDAGLRAETTVYVGVDVPDRVKNIRIQDNRTSITLMWDKVGSVGANGGIVKPEEVEYLVWSTVGSGGSYFLDEVQQVVQDDNSATLAINTGTGEQHEQYWAVQPRNAAGVGAAYMKSLLVGKPYTLPFKETVSGGEMNNFWDLQRTSSAVSIGLSNEYTDGDGYAFQMISTEAGEEGELYSGKISLAGAKNPMLTFNLKGAPANNGLGIYVARSGGAESLLGIASTQSDFTTQKFSLKDYSSEEFIRLIFIGSFEEAGSIVFDNINVLDMLDHNLSVSNLEAPVVLQAGDEGRISVRVTNLGDAPATGYTVKMAAGDKELLNETVSETLPSMGSRTFEATYKTTIFDVAGNIPVVAQVVYASDGDNSDNETATTVRLTAASSNSPGSLTAVEADGHVRLDWTAPTMRTTQQTESFEDTERFPLFSIGGVTATKHSGTLGGWTLYDADGGTTYQWSVPYDNRGQQMAWQVINPKNIFGESIYEADLAQDGEQYLISFCTMSGATDDWLISPQLPGVAQTVTYYVRCLTLQYGNEPYEVLYSTTDNNIGSFQKIGETLEATVLWEGRTFDLPEGTKYFALRHVATEAFGLLIDNVTYTVEGGDVASYNIYVDGLLVANVDGTRNFFDELDGALAQGSHVFSVTALYADGSESAPVSTMLATGITDIASDGTPADVYSLDGRLIRRQARNVEGLPKGVYVIDGRKAVIR
ncbi:MAG: choice-of-anchor J domain-containing protein [Alloprevotella sp.]|nr:choice-of-anchor J domain-containing protein [Alloprevotella sp.]